MARTAEGSLHSLLDDVQEFCQGQSLEREFKDFAETQLEVFREVLSLDTHDEHPLEYHRAYQQYLKRFEGRIEGFITQIGGTVSEFYVQCKDVLQHGDTMESRRFFIKALLATSEYEAFFWLMKNEVKCRK